MSSATEEKPRTATELLHAAALGAAALGLLSGLLVRNLAWLNVGVSLILLLPPLRLATTIYGEARGQRFAVAVMGVLVLAFLLLSRRFS
jgi:hypothetical protein